MNPRTWFLADPLVWWTAAAIAAPGLLVFWAASRKRYYLALLLFAIALLIELSSWRLFVSRGLTDEDYSRAWQTAIGLIAGIYLVWRLVRPSQLRIYPSRKGYIVGIVLIGLGAFLLLLDQPHPPSRFNKAHDDFAVGIEDPASLRGVQFDIPPKIEVLPTQPKWEGTFYVSAHSHRLAKGERRRINIGVVLPNYSEVSILQEDRRKVALQQIDKPPDFAYVEVRIHIAIDRRHPRDSAGFSFKWSPPQVDQRRLGEERVVLVRNSPSVFGIGEPWPQRPLDESPTLRVYIDPETTEFGIVDRLVDISSTEALGWRLNSQDGGIEQSEFSIISRQVRFLADQIVQLIILGAGLLLGALSQSTSQPPMQSELAEPLHMLGADFQRLQADVHEMKHYLTDSGIQKRRYLRKRNTNQFIVGTIAGALFIWFVRPRIRRR